MYVPTPAISATSSSCVRRGLTAARMLALAGFFNVPAALEPEPELDNADLPPLDTPAPELALVLAAGDLAVGAPEATAALCVMKVGLLAGASAIDGWFARKIVNLMLVGTLLN